MNSQTAQAAYSFHRQGYSLSAISSALGDLPLHTVAELINEGRHESRTEWTGPNQTGAPWIWKPANNLTYR